MLPFAYLRQLSDMYAGSANCQDYLAIKGIRDFKIKSGTCYKANKSQFTPSFTKGLYKDIEKLYSRISFTIMLTSYNSSKGKGKQ